MIAASFCLSFNFITLSISNIYSVMQYLSKSNLHIQVAGFDKRITMACLRQTLGYNWDTDSFNNPYISDS